MKTKHNENKIPDISNLVNKTELKNVEKKNLMLMILLKKKTDYSTEIAKIKNDYFTNTALTSTIFKGDYYYNQQSYLLFKARLSSFEKSGWNIISLKSSGIYGSNEIFTNSVNNSKNSPTNILNQNARPGVTFSGNILKQDKINYPYDGVFTFCTN